MKIKIGLFLGALVLLNGCSQKVTMKALVPAQIDRIANTKKITVANFSNDRVGLSRKIEANLANIRIDDKKYFTLVSRNDFDKLIKEQHIQNSGLVDPKTVVEVGQLIGAEAIINGNVGRVTSQDRSFFEQRTQCADRECKQLMRYKVRCKQRVIGLSSELRIVDVQRGDVIYADTFNDRAVYKHCSDDQRVIPSIEIVAQSLASKMAYQFTYKLAPHYKYFKVALLENPDLDYTDKQKELLKFSLEYIKHERYEKAEKLLIRLVDSTDSQSYVAFYNLGVISEARGKLVDAKEYYAYADNLMITPVEEINEAVQRIDRLIQKRAQTRKQINR